MKQINFTKLEANTLVGFLQGVLIKVHETPDLKLPNKKVITTTLESIMGKLETLNNNN
jgi:hypothetical protein